MAQLTWRNVDAPSFRDSMDGYRIASDQLNSAFRTARETLSAFDRNKTDAVNKSFAAALAGYTDPEALQNDLRTGALLGKFDLNSLSAEQLSSIPGRVNTLLDTKDKMGDVAWEGKERGWTEGDRLALEAASPFLSKASILRGQGKTVEADAILGSPEAIAAMSKINPQKINELLQGGMGLANSRQGYDQSATRFSNEQTDRTEGRQSTLAAQSLIRESGALDGADLVRYIDSNYEKLAGQYTPMVLNMARSKALADPTLKPLDYDWAAEGGAGGGGTTGGTAGSEALRIMNYQARAAGFEAVPDDVKTLGDASDFAIRVNKAGVPSSAMGVYQIVGDTLRRYAAKEFGPNWRNTNFDLEAQDRLAKAIWEDNKSPAALRKQWVSLSDADARKAASLPWEQARVIIAAGESGANPNELFAQATAAKTTAQGNISGNPSVEIVRSFQEKFADKTPPLQVARQLTGKGGALEGQNPEMLVSKINEIMEKPGINAAMAGEILARSVGDRRGAVGEWINARLPWGDGLTFEFNDEKIKNLSETLTNPQLLRDAALLTKQQAENIAQTDAAEASQRRATAAANAKALRAETLGRRNTGQPELRRTSRATQTLKNVVEKTTTDAIVAGREDIPFYMKWKKP